MLAYRLAKPSTALAAAFRLVGHTTFDLYAAPLLWELGCDDWAYIRLLLSL